MGLYGPPRASQGHLVGKSQPFYPNGEYKVLIIAQIIEIALILNIGALLMAVFVLRSKGK